MRWFWYYLMWVESDNWIEFLILVVFFNLLFPKEKEQ